MPPRASHATQVPALVALALLLSPFFFAGCATQDTGRLGAKDLIDLGRYYYQHGKFELAEREFRAALDLEPQNPAGLVGLASICLARGQAFLFHKEPRKAEQEYRLAELHFKAAIRLKPKDVDAQLGLGQTYCECRLPELAIPPLREAVHLASGDAPKLLRAHYYLGLSLALQKEYPEARKVIKAFLEALPKGQMETERKELEALMGDLEKEVARDP
ncbi:MAG: tetratricopeptide repeat protein [Planctomycetes bacterium]|nr:tetratricopeptide repeat protein [Planctomycetota bacterium]